MTGCSVGLDVTFLRGSGGSGVEIEAGDSDSWLRLLKALSLYFSLSSGAATDECCCHIAASKEKSDRCGVELQVFVSIVSIAGQDG